MELIKYKLGQNNNVDVLFDKDNETFWMNQKMMSMLFGTTTKAISLHIKNIIKDNEIDVFSVEKFYLTTANDGKKYNTKIYELELIIEVGCRVKSKH